MKLTSYYYILPNRVKIKNKISKMKIDVKERTAILLIQLEVLDLTPSLGCSFCPLPSALTQSHTETGSPVVSPAGPPS
jgi:hypothetical protein